MYSDEEMLMLSGIQHFRFCPRQWALIHIEQQWDDNRLTAEGSILHKHVDDPFYRQKCGNHICLRAVNIASRELGLYGVTDIVELHPTSDSSNCIYHPQYSGMWQPYPVEYKHGRPKCNEIDEVQLAAQTICLEEQYGINIEYGAFFYAEIKQRIEVYISKELRDTVRICADNMHKVYNTGQLPLIESKKQCKSCSLADICMPQMASIIKASYYLASNLYA